MALLSFFYFVSASLFLFNFYYNNYVTVPALIADGVAKPMPIPHWTMYLTQIDVTLSAIYYSLSFMSQVRKSSSASVSRLLTLAFYSVIAPVGTIVAVYFWSIYLYDPDLM